MKKINRFLFTTMIMFLFWLAYTSSFQREELLAGLVASIVIALFTHDLFTEKGFSGNIFKKFFYIIIYIPVFIWEMIKANLDVAKRVINPSLPINPGIVAIKTGISSEAGRMFLANSITLTPGTLTMDVSGDTLYVHWIDVQADEPEQQQKQIAGKFEHLLGGIF